MKELTKKSILRDTNTRTMWSVFRYVMDNNNTDIIVRKDVDKLVIIYKGVQYDPFRNPCTDSNNMHNENHVLSTIDYNYEFLNRSGLQVYSYDIKHITPKTYVFNPKSDVRIVRDTALLIYEYELSNDEMIVLNGEEKFINALSWFHELMLNIICYSKNYTYIIESDYVIIYHELNEFGKVAIEY